jgi:hypothetical protein
VLDPIVYWMPGVERDIGRCLDFACNQPRGSSGDVKIDVQRAVAWICANPGANRPEFKAVDAGWWLRRHNAAHILIVYAYLPPTGGRPRGVIILVAVRYMRVASLNVESETTVTNFVPNPDDPDDYDLSDCTLDREDQIDWDEIVAATEEKENSEELAFNSADYATEEEAIVALRAFIHEIFEEVERDAASDPALDASGQTGHQKGAQLRSSAALGKAAGS